MHTASSDGSPDTYDASPEVELTLLEYNVYYDNLSPRFPAIAQDIAGADPDIGALTEFVSYRSKSIRAQLVGALALQKRQYKFTEDVAGMGNIWTGVIFYDSLKFQVQMHGTEVYKDAVNQHDPRGFCWAVLRHVATQRDFLVYGTHPVSVLVGAGVATYFQVRNAAQLLDHASHMRGLPTIVLGDLNCTPLGPSLRSYLGNFVDTYAGKPPRGTLRSDPHARIDFILVAKEKFQVMSADILSGAVGGSDHFPVVAQVKALGALV